MAMMAEFDNYLQSLLSLKPPGISTSKVKEATGICSQNVQVLQVLIVTPIAESLLAPWW